MTEELGVPSGPETGNGPERRGELSQLQVTVRHLLDVWPSVLQRRCFLRAMARSEALRGALEKTYAGHVFNAVHGALSFDLVRAVGALILDRRKGTASLYRAVVWLRKPIVIKQLRSQVYEVYGSSTVRVGHVAAEVESALEQIHRREFDATFNCVPGQLDDIEAKVLDAPIASIIEDMRNKTVAHSAVEHDGADWKMWAVIGGTKLTYGQLDEYIDLCTTAIDTLTHLVLRTSYPFEDLPGINQRYVDEYIDALAIGLNQQKQAKQQQREENLRRMRDRMAITPGEPGGSR